MYSVSLQQVSNKAKATPDVVEDMLIASHQNLLHEDRNITNKMHKAVLLRSEHEGASFASWRFPQGVFLRYGKDAESLENFGKGAAAENDYRGAEVHRRQLKIDRNCTASGNARVPHKTLFKQGLVYKIIDFRLEARLVTKRFFQKNGSSNLTRLCHLLNFGCCYLPH